MKILYESAYIINMLREQSTSTFAPDSPVGPDVVAEYVAAAKTHSLFGTATDSVMSAPVHG